jgi:hypothetical protein
MTRDFSLEVDNAGRSDTHVPHLSFWEATRFRIRPGLISFGGTAGQICVSGLIGFIGYQILLDDIS